MIEKKIEKNQSNSFEYRSAFIQLCTHTSINQSYFILVIINLLLFESLFQIQIQNLIIPINLFFFYKYRCQHCRLQKCLVMGMKSDCKYILSFLFENVRKLFKVFSSFSIVTGALIVRISNEDLKQFDLNCTR